MEESVEPASRGELPRREVMQTPDEVAAMLRLKALGWGVRRIAGELGCSHMTLRQTDHKKVLCYRATAGRGIWRALQPTLTAAARKGIRSSGSPRLGEWLRSNSGPFGVT
jgi:hypothetical protein